MERKNVPDLEDWLKALGIDSLCQWDVLIFVYRHQTSLVSAEHIGRLLGYETGAVVAALDDLESLELVERSRVSQGVRLYQFTTPDGRPRGDAFDWLMSLAESRAGRLRLAEKLRRDPPSSPPLKEGGQDEADGPSRPRGNEGSRTWLKAI